MRAMEKREIARVLKEVAFFLLLRGESPHKARAYRHAATALLSCPDTAAHLVRSGRLTQVRGIGPATASIITELVDSGVSAYHHEIRGMYPPSLVELADIPGLRVKQIKRLFDVAGIRSIADLQAACRGNHVPAVPGVGLK